MISSIAWARRGVPARIPTTEEALEEAGAESAPAGKSSSSADASAKDASKGAKGKRAHRGDSSESDSDDESGLARITAGNLMQYRSNADDPYITLKEDDDLDSEIDDFEIQSTDLVLLGARSDEQLSNLECYVYEEPVDNLYPHHDIPLPIFPLCLAWLTQRPGGGPSGNFAAVGTFAPYIEVWDLDVIDALEPLAILGAEAAAALGEQQFTSAAAESLVGSSKKKASKEPKRKKKATLGA